MSGLWHRQGRLTRGLICCALGSFIGLSTGVAALGGAVNGALVFGPIGFLIGWMMPTPPVRTDWPPGDSSADADDARPEAHLGQTEAPRGDYQRVEDSLKDIIPIVGRLLGSVWNLEMRLLIAVGLMPYLVRHPWLLFGIAFVMLALVFPLGVVFTITGLAAMSYGAEPSSRFLVDPTRRTD